ncbi:transmembrane [Cystoisospora suis]|uniref:Transmembrane n=1 Tax=Cystoisospora suis TaxID=483139 RepID=A0A2C6L0U3_9APIC|nr:transmembrane [Cystoisospora suis]
MRCIYSCMRGGAGGGGGGGVSSSSSSISSIHQKEVVSGRQGLVVALSSKQISSSSFTVLSTSSSSQSPWDRPSVGFSSSSHHLSYRQKHASVKPFCSFSSSAWRRDSRRPSTSLSCPFPHTSSPSISPSSHSSSSSSPYNRRPPLFLLHYSRLSSPGRRSSSRSEVFASRQIAPSVFLLPSFHASSFSPSSSQQNPSYFYVSHYLLRFLSSLSSSIAREREGGGGGGIPSRCRRLQQVSLYLSFPLSTSSTFFLFSPSILKRERMNSHSNITLHSSFADLSSLSSTSTASSSCSSPLSLHSPSSLSPLSFLSDGNEDGRSHRHLSTTTTIARKIDFLDRHEERRPGDFQEEKHPPRVSSSTSEADGRLGQQEEEEGQGEDEEIMKTTEKRKQKKKTSSQCKTRNKIEGISRCRVLQLAQMAANAALMRDEEGETAHRALGKMINSREKDGSTSLSFSSHESSLSEVEKNMKREIETEKKIELSYALHPPQNLPVCEDNAMIRERKKSEEEEATTEGEQQEEKKKKKDLADEFSLCTSSEERQSIADSLVSGDPLSRLNGEREDIYNALREEEESVARLERACKEISQLKVFFDEVGQAVKIHERKVLIKSQGREVRNALKSLLRAERYLEERKHERLQALNHLLTDTSTRQAKEEEREEENPSFSTLSESAGLQSQHSLLLHRSTHTSTAGPIIPSSSSLLSSEVVVSSASQESSSTSGNGLLSPPPPLPPLSSGVSPVDPVSCLARGSPVSFPEKRYEVLFSPSLPRSSSFEFFPIGESLAFVFIADVRLYRCWLSCIADRWRGDLHAWLDRQDDLKRGDSQPSESSEYERFLAFFMPHVKRAISHALDVLIHYEVNAVQRVLNSFHNLSICQERDLSISASVSSCKKLSERMKGAEEEQMVREARRRVWVLGVSLLEEVTEVVALLKEMAQRRVLLHFAPLVLHVIHLESQARQGLLEASPVPPLAPSTDSVEAAGAASFKAFLQSPAGQSWSSESRVHSVVSRGHAGGGRSSHSTCYVDDAKETSIQRRKEEAGICSPSSSGSLRPMGTEVHTQLSDYGTSHEDRASASLSSPIFWDSSKEDLSSEGRFSSQKQRERAGEMRGREEQKKPLLSSSRRPTAAEWSGHLQVSILRSFGRMGLYSEKLLHIVSDQSRCLWPEDLVFFLFECGRYGLAVQHLIDRHAVEAAGILDKISDPLLYLTTAALHRSSASHRIFFDAALPRLGAAIATYEDPAFLRTMLSICRALDPHCELPQYTRLAARAAVAMRRFVPYLDINTLALLLGIVDNRSARTPWEYFELARASCKRIEDLQRAYERRRLIPRSTSSLDLQGEGLNHSGHRIAPHDTSGNVKVEENAVAGSSRSSFLHTGVQDESMEPRTVPNVFETLSSALALGDVVFGLSSFGIVTPLYPLLEEMAVQRLEGILFSKKEALWFLVWAALAAAPGFTPRKLTLALREKMLEDGSSEVQNCFTSISHTVQKLGAFHVQRLLLPLQLMGVYDADIIRVCLETSLDRDRSSFKRVDAALSLAFPLAFANVLPTEHLEELLSVWQVNCSKIFVIGNAFRGEFARACMIAVLWAAALKNLHTRQTSVVQHLDKLFACLDAPPSLYAWKEFSKPTSSGTSRHPSFYSFNRTDEFHPSSTSDSPSLLFSNLPRSTDMQGPSQRGVMPSCSSQQPPMKGWHSLSDLRQHDRMAVLQMKKPLQLVQQIAATYLADIPHAVRRCNKYPLIRAWANAAADPGVDEDPSVSQIVNELQNILFVNGIRSRAFVPVTSGAIQGSKRLSASFGEAVACGPGEGGSSSDTNQEDFYPLTTSTPQCIHLHLLDATKESSVCSGTSAVVNRKCGVIVFGEHDGLATLPEWDTTYFDTGVNAMRLRCLRQKGWELIAINMHEWRESKTDDAKLSLFLDKCDNSGIFIPFCVE